MWCCYLIPIIFGIVILVKGQVMLTYNRKVYGVPARIIGVILLLPLPLTLFSWMLLGAFSAALDKPIDEEKIGNAVIISVVAIIALCLLAVIVIAIVYSEPIRKRRVDDAIEVVDVPERYSEHFQATEQRPSISRTDSTDTTNEPPPIAPPDDPIQR